MSDYYTTKAQALKIRKQFDKDADMSAIADWARSYKPGASREMLIVTSDGRIVGYAHREENMWTGADYVDDDTAKQYNLLGRALGRPVISVSLSDL